MHVLIANNTVIPTKDYGGTERIIWWLGQELVKLGHEVSYLVSKGSSCPFAKQVLALDDRPLEEQIPVDVDVVHLNFQISEPIKKPYVITYHGNYSDKPFDINTIYVSRNHALRNGSECYVYNGINIEDYGSVNFNQKRRHLLFLAYAKRPEKNLKDCIHIAFQAKEKLAVVGGKRRFDQNGCAWWAKYYGMIGGDLKNKVLGESKALLFPVLWHEPFGIAIIEAMYFGSPVFATTYGSLPELVSSQQGLLSNSRSELIRAVKNIGQYNPRLIHQYVCDNFNSKKMTQDYLKKYEIVLNGGTLNKTPPQKADNHNKNELLPMYP